MLHLLRTIDAHVGGAPLRLVVDGMPRPIGKTIAQKRDWVRRHADALRRAIVLEPRGHRDMCAAMLVDPVAPGSSAGIIFMQDDGYPAVSGHGVIAVATIGVERGLFGGAPDTSLAFDTAAGTVYARARVQPRGERTAVDSVSFTNVPSFVFSGGHAVRLGTRELRVDIAYGGAFYAIVDTEAIGVPLIAAKLPELRRLGVEIRSAINAAGTVAHPLDAHLTGVAGVIFTGPPQDPEAHLRNVTVFGQGAADRSPCATGTAAVMAVLDAMGLIQDQQPFVHESLIGSLHRGRITQRTQVGEFAAILTEVEGTAWITGDHTFQVDDDDALKDGFEL
jgi:trans-L-3-hydroxyproline dehydratase